MLLCNLQNCLSLVKICGTTVFGSGEDSKLSSYHVVILSCCYWKRRIPCFHLLVMSCSHDCCALVMLGCNGSDTVDRVERTQNCQLLYWKTVVLSCYHNVMFCMLWCYAVDWWKEWTALLRNCETVMLGGYHALVVLCPNCFHVMLSCPGSYALIRHLSP